MDFVVANSWQCFTHGSHGEILYIIVISVLFVYFCFPVCCHCNTLARIDESLKLQSYYLRFLFNSVMQVFLVTLWDVSFHFPYAICWCMWHKQNSLTAVFKNSSHIIMISADSVEDLILFCFFTLNDFRASCNAG